VYGLFIDFVLTAEIKIVVFCVVMLCSDVVGYYSSEDLAASIFRVK
jgi:hypothetical protein